MNQRAISVYIPWQMRLPLCCFTQNGLDLIPGIGDAGDRLYLGATAAEIAPPPDTISDTRSDGEASAKKLKSSIQ